MTQVSSEIAVPLDIRAKRRDTFTLNLEVTDSDGNDFEFSSHTAKMQVRTALYADGGDLLLTLQTGDGITLSTGRVALVKAAADMNIEPGEYFYDLQVVYPDASVKTWVSGGFTVTDDVTV